MLAEDVDEAAQHGVSLVHCTLNRGQTPAPTAFQCLALGPCDQRKEPSQALLGTLVQR